MPVEDLSIFLYKLTRILFVSLLSLIIYYLINIGNNYIEDEKKININHKLIIPSIIGIVFLIIIYKLFQKYSILPDTLFTVLFSIVLAYLFNPIIGYFEEKGLTRFWSVIVLYLIILGIILIFAFLIVPKIGSEVKKFASHMPVYISKVSNFIDSMSSKYDTTVGELPPMFDGIQNAIKENIASIEKVVIGSIKSFFTGIADMLSKVVSLILTPILTLYFLIDKEYFISKVLKIIPEKHMDESMELFREIDDSLSKFVRGRLFMAAYVGISITIVLLVLRVDFAIAIGFITGFADIIPYIGPFLGFIPAVFFALLDSPIKALWVAGLFLLVQWTENNILAPKIIGDTTGLHPMTVLLSIIVGGGMFGVVGMIFSVPVVAVGVILYNFIIDKLMKKTA